jgi:hypothetical protein
MTHEQYIETMTLTAGDRLPNGWIVVDATGDADHAVVLAFNGQNTHPFATWFARMNGDGLVTFWGTYHLELLDAMDAFFHRSAA